MRKALFAAVLMAAAQPGAAAAQTAVQTTQDNRSARLRRLGRKWYQLLRHPR